MRKEKIMKNSLDKTLASDITKKNKKRKMLKKIFKTIIIVLIILAVGLFVAGKFGLFAKKNSNSQTNLTTYTVSTRSITQVLTSTGTIEPKNQYTINALVSGEIIGDYFEEGDTVTEDQLLYKIDSDNLESGVTRAENALKNASKSLDSTKKNLEKLNVKSDYSGTVEKIYVEVGDEIAAGTLVAHVRDSDTMCIDIPFMDFDITSIKVGDTANLTFNTYEESTGIVTEISNVKTINSLGVAVRNVTITAKNHGSITTSSSAYAQIGDAYCTAPANFYYNDEGQVFAKISGTVKNIYYNEGSNIKDGNTLILLENTDLEDQVELLQDTLNEAQNTLDDAKNAFDNYNIEAPITGKVISKSYKSGDIVTNGQNSPALAVIYDMSSLKFSMNIDELDIDKIDKGQEVIITCDSREGEEYRGAISNISIQGSTSNGTTVYPVEVTIENVEDFEKRTVDEDGTINKVYKTGMTSTQTTYKLLSSENTNSGKKYIYSDDIQITVNTTADGITIYDGEKLLNKYIENTYTQGSYFYEFAEDFSSMTLEIQNDKKMLRPGMNIDASIVVENRQNVIAVPLAAVGRGNIVKVLKNKDAGSSTDDSANQQNATDSMPQFERENMPKFDMENMPQFDRENMPEFDRENMPDFGENKNFGNNSAKNSNNKYGNADINSEYEEVKVTIGISDDDYVEITSGLEVGDVIIIDNSNLASQSQSTPFGMMGGMPGGMGGSMGGMPDGGMMGGVMPSGGMGGQRPSMGR